MRIIGPPSAERGLVLARLWDVLGNVHIRFGSEMFSPLWIAAATYGIDPVGVIAQAWKETGGGRFTGQVSPQFYNTAGIKVRHVGKYPGVDDGDRPLAHAQFASWDVGAVAHVQHLCAYAGVPLEGHLIVDPRYTLVAGKHRLEQWSDLGGKWAPSSSYGTELEAIMRRLQGPAG